MKMIADVAYAPEHGDRGLGDLYLPERCQGAPVALAIHGGGWNAMDKYSWSGVAEFMCRQGFAAYNINYRLLDIAPWPACGDDCLAAAEFLLAGGHEAMQPLDRSAVVIIGGSAGGHLTLMTGLRLPQENVRAMIAVSAPGDLLWRAENVSRDFGGKFFGTDGEATDEMLRDASANKYVTAGAPPVLCVHSTNDKTVPIEQARRLVDLYSKVGARAELYAHPGPGEQHGIWIEGSDPHRFLPNIEEAISAFLKTV